MTDNNAEHNGPTRSRPEPKPIDTVEPKAPNRESVSKQSAHDFSSVQQRIQNLKNGSSPAVWDIDDKNADTSGINVKIPINETLSLPNGVSIRCWSIDSGTRCAASPSMSNQLDKVYGLEEVVPDGLIGKAVGTAISAALSLTGINPKLAQVIGKLIGSGLSATPTQKAADDVPQFGPTELKETIRKPELFKAKPGLATPTPRATERLPNILI